MQNVALDAKFMKLNSTNPAIIRTQQMFDLGGGDINDYTWQYVKFCKGASRRVESH